VLTAYRWELRKLVSQRRIYLGIGGAAAAPILLTIVLAVQKGGPYDEPLGPNMHTSGIALALVVLGLAARFGAQLATALVAGDIVASEDADGTLKMILTRSLKRSQILTAKTLATFTYLLVLLLVLLAASLSAGLARRGFNPLVDLSQGRISPVRALELSIAAFAIFALPLAGIAAFGILLSVLTRNSAAAIVGTLLYQLLMEGASSVVHVPVLGHYLLASQFDAWHGLFQTPIDWTPVIRASWDSALFTIVPLLAAFAIFLRRDVTG